jgi:F-type H+-transporting ATPase subunit a
MAAGGEHAFTWPQIIPGLNQLPDHVATAGIVTAALVGVAFLARHQVARAGDAAVVPDGTLTARNFYEVYVEQFTALVEGVLGPNSRQYVPLYGAMFLFILANNLSGLIPGLSPATSNTNTTLGLGLLSFVMYNVFGFRKHGIGYLKHFLGPIWWLVFLMLPLEIIDNILRPITLNLRLQMNMFADHLVLEIFTDLTKVLIPVLFYMLGTFVCVIQAFVFTLLSLVYVSLATAGHDHHDEAHDEAHGHGTAHAH